MNTINELVYGHARAKRVLEALINRSQERYYKKCVTCEPYPNKLNCLLIGESGTGKTHLIHSLQKIHNFPLLCIDATELMPTGNDNGVNRKQLRKQILDMAGELVKTNRYHSITGVLNQMVIFVDEFDKLGTPFDSSGQWNKHVQANFLTMIEDQDLFEGISWVFAGAFTGLREDKQNVSNGIGFFAESEKSVTKEITDRDIIRAGIITEMLGRISLIVELDSFTAADYRTVLVDWLLPNYDVDIDVDDVVNRAMTSGQGIRSLTRQLELAAIDQKPAWIMPKSF